MRHTVTNCWHRFDKSFHTPSEQMNHHNFSQHPSAFYAVPQTVNDSSWYMDSGASYHVAPKATQLNQFAPTSKKYLFTCTGEKVDIVGIGNTSLPKSNLSIRNMLIVPSATKKLLSVDRLTGDNQVKVIFTNGMCVVKDKRTGQRIARGKAIHGLYLIAEQPNNIQRQPEVNLATVKEKEQKKFMAWHCKLGHPSTRIL